jgi:transposase-like protein
VLQGRKRRAWSNEEKRAICAQARVPGVAVSQVARRYNANTNLVFTWLRDPRFAPDDALQEASTFLPVEIIEERQGVGSGMRPVILSVTHKSSLFLAPVLIGGT